jgi:hypothetical protein
MHDTAGNVPVRASVHPQCSALTAGSETQKWRESREKPKFSKIRVGREKVVNKSHIS